MDSNFNVKISLLFVLNVETLRTVLERCLHTYHVPLIGIKLKTKVQGWKNFKKGSGFLPEITGSIVSTEITVTKIPESFLFIFIFWTEITVPKIFHFSFRPRLRSLYFWAEITVPKIFHFSFRPRLRSL